MSQFSEKLPSGLTIIKREDLDYYQIERGYRSGGWLTREDIARMYGIAFPTKRHPGTCCITAASPEVDDINVADLQPPAAGDKYKQRVNQSAKTYVDSFYSYDVDAKLSDFQYEGRKAVAAQAEAIRHMFSEFGIRGVFMEEKLIENGYVPAPVSCAHGVPCTEICYVCGINSPE